ncbi:MAG: hypothetical protein ACRDUA_18405 [Micromonosporaceae bacterium]
MSRTGCAAGNCLPGSGSPWFLLVLGAVWAVVVILVGLWGITEWRERRPAGGTRAVPRRFRQAPTGRGAVSVQEITQRLDRERALRAQRPPRRVVVIRRAAPQRVERAQRIPPPP